MDIRQLIDTSRMTGYQWFIIAIALFVNALDGYDMVAMAFASTTVTEEFGLTGGQLGWLLSSALIGIGLGSLLLAPLADRFGRRFLITLALSIDLLGLVLTALAPSFGVLLIARALTGVGVGGILAGITVLVSEYSNLRFRGLAMAIYACGYGLGASLCGVIAGRYIPTHGWEIIFWVGAALTAVSLVLTTAFIPESPDFLAANGREDKVRAVAARLGHGTNVTVSAPTASADRGSFTDLLAPQFRSTTIKLWIGFTLVMFAFTFANQWTPKLLTEAGLTAEQGILGGIMLSFGGTIGAIVFGIISTKIDSRPLLVAFSLASAVILVGFIFAASTPTLMFALGVGVGLFLNACVSGLYTVTPEAYPSAIRTTGVGTTLAVGRAGAIASPILAGYLLDAGWTPGALYTGAAVAVVGAAVALIGVKAYTARTEQQAPQREVAHVD